LSSASHSRWLIADGEHTHGASAVGRPVVEDEPDDRHAASVDHPRVVRRVAAPNIARFIFLHPASQALYHDWENLAGDTVALLRAEAGRDPYDRALTDLIGELSTRSDVVRTWWAAHNVRLYRSGVKHLHHPGVGDLTLAYERAASWR
jgi:hypothetical protein